MFSRVCTVCTGNICRSPMAEAWLAHRAGDRLTQVFSAGIGALVDHPADDHAIKVMAARDIDLSAHRARQATAELMATADLVLAMDGTHLDWLTRRFPQMRGRTFKLLHWRDGADIPDPYRLPEAAFEHAFELVAQGVDDWLERIG